MNLMALLLRTASGKGADLMTWIADWSRQRTHRWEGVTHRNRIIMMGPGDLRSCGGCRDRNRYCQEAAHQGTFDFKTSKVRKWT
jgi:hypothetical protein